MWKMGRYIKWYNVYYNGKTWRVYQTLGYSRGSEFTMVFSGRQPVTTRLFSWHMLP